ncbi:putative histone-arginine methyltransferase 1.3 [Morella rubra]|uniref:type I protein arginine methyltransferase n=1 Tax=Morella rubra TaxID=262757 RepID=A0A6A1VMM8_9ROSI|nr:putative histone-arginine methyltransferase 1.3 [Morella rubra]
MEGPIGQEHKQHEFALLSVSELSLSCSESPSKPVIARFSVDSGVAELRLHKESESIAAWNVDLQAARLFKLGPVQSTCIYEGSDASQETIVLGTYYAAIIENRADFTGRVVVDVGAGSGILSLFAAQAGAKHVYAVEASEMAEYARKLIAGNPSLGQRITVIKGKVEEVELPEKADILISEPMGTLLVNERMLESYVIARDRFLAPNGKMLPTVGRFVFLVNNNLNFLYLKISSVTLAFALFWQQQNYYGVDLTPLYGSAFQGYFSQPVVDAFDPRLLVAPPMFHLIDFMKIKEEDLYEIDIPLRFISSVGARVHGLACWFDVLFNGSTVQRWLTTAPGAPTTHWYQLRCVLSQPIYVMAGQEITGRLHMIAHNAQTKMWGPGAEQGEILQTSSCKLDLKEPYYRMSQPQAYPLAQDQQSQQLISTQKPKSRNFLPGAGVLSDQVFFAPVLPYHLTKPIYQLQCFYTSWRINLFEKENGILD